MKHSKGISLPEIIIGITIAGIVGGILINLLVSSNSLFFDQSIKVRQGLSLNQAVSEITASIRSVSGIAAQYPPTGTAQYTTNADTLVLKVPSINQNGDVLEQVFDYIVLSKDTANHKILRKQIFTDPSSYRKPENKVLLTNLESIEFIFLDGTNNQVAPAEAVRITFILNLSESNGTLEEKSSSSGTANLNN